VEGEEIDPRKAESGKGSPENLLELIRIGLWGYLGLENELFPRDLLQDGGKLRLGSSISPSRFDVGYPKLQSSMDSS
jgi:hypothetical protein